MMGARASTSALGRYPLGLGSPANFVEPGERGQAVGHPTMDLIADGVVVPDAHAWRDPSLEIELQYGTLDRVVPLRRVERSRMHGGVAIYEFCRPSFEARQAASRQSVAISKGARVVLLATNAAGARRPLRAVLIGSARTA
jgi:hypothetical protein